MKIYTSTRTYTICLCLLIFFSACKKENFAKDFEGSYKGAAQETIYSNTAGVPHTVNNYSNARIRVEEVNRFNVRVTITLDIANPTVTRSLELKILTEKSFNAYSGNSRGTPGWSYQGIINNDSLDYAEMRSIFSQFKFKGKKG